MRKSRKQPKILPNNAAELPVVRAIQAGLSEVQDLILKGSSGPQLIRKLSGLRGSLRKLESGIVKNYLRGSIRNAVRARDEQAADEVIEQLSSDLLKKEE